MGGRFWLGLFAAVIGIGIAVGVLFAIIGAALFAWGIFGAFVVFGLLALGIAWIYDKRKQAEYED